MARTFGGDFVWPRDDHGDSYAAFELGSFTATKGGVARGCGSIDFVIHVAAVIGEENDDGIIGEFELVESIEKGSDGIVHGFDHGRVGRATLRGAFIDEGSVFLNELFFSVEGSMDAEHPIIKEEWLIFVPLHEG